MATQVSKLAYVDNKLGATMPGQQTTRYIYDSVALGIGQQNATFFQNFAGKTQFQTNLTTNKLDASESMVIKSIYLAFNNQFIDNLLADHSNLNIYVGNQVVLKDFNVAFNARAAGTAFDRLHNVDGSSAIVEVRLLTDIVIPPQVNFKATIEFATAPQAEYNMTLGLKGYGKIFSAGASF